MLRKLSLTLLLALGSHAVISHAPAQSAPAEAHASTAFEAARRAGPPALRAFIEKMPKGADLHMHLSGAIYAETFLQDAVRDKLCLDPVQHTLQPSAATCPENQVPAAQLLKNQKLYDAFIDAFSMRAFIPSTGVSGHDQFFATFDRFGLAGHAPGRNGEWLDEVASRAAAQNEQYLEVMMTPDFSKAIALSAQFGWPTPPQPATTAANSLAPAPDGASRAELSTYRDKLLAAGLRDNIVVDTQQLDSALADRQRLERCGESGAAPACAVQVRVIYQVLRAFPPQQVFAQTLLAFEVAAADTNIVGLNFVQPEDAYMAMTEYHRQMEMLDYLHSVYPQVHISLHAGELAPGMVPPAGERFHIREAVDLGHAERIGHGVDVLDETDPNLLLKELADRHVMVEINLTSNDVILGVSANHHSLPAYRAAHVPVALSTDDEGVSRIDLTHEYARAAVDFQLSYVQLKQMARTGIHHTFLSGPSLWQKPDDFTRVVSACAAQPLGAETPNAACTAYLKDSPHAAQEWELEHRFRFFESTL